jgi:hypothetical protein
VPKGDEGNEGGEQARGDEVRLEDLSQGNRARALWKEDVHCE